MKNNPEIWEALHLKKDGTFNYQFCNSMSPYPKLTGDWKLNHYSVIINSTAYSVLFDGDTLKLKNVVYYVKFHSLKRSAQVGHIKLKKIKLHSEKLIFNYETF